MSSTKILFPDEDPSGVLNKKKRGKSPPAKKRERSPPEKSISKGAKRSPKNKPSTETTFTLSDLNVFDLDKKYALPDIARRQESSSQRKEESEDIKHLTTSLVKLGISTVKKEAAETICWGDHYKIRLFVSNGVKRTELTEQLSPSLRCTWCHLPPEQGSLMLALPIKYVPSFVHQHVYAPECVNIVEDIKVRPSKEEPEDEKKKFDPKNAPKINYFRRDITEKDKASYQNEEFVEKDYFECAYPVCSFSCMLSKGRELSQKDPRFRNFRMNISFLYQKIFGVMPEGLIPAAPCTTMIQYMGDHTPEEFRKNFKFVRVQDTDQFFFNHIMRDCPQVYVQTERVNA